MACPYPNLITRSDATGSKSVATRQLERVEEGIALIASRWEVASDPAETPGSVSSAETAADLLGQF
jgi:hypothetical protein